MQQKSQKQRYKVGSLRVVSTMIAKFIFAQVHHKKNNICAADGETVIGQRRQPIN